jgi:hypothetical protein
VVPYLGVLLLSPHIIPLSQFRTLILVDAKVCLVITPPPDDRSALVLVPLNVFLASLNVSDVGSAAYTCNGRDGDNRVRGRVLEPYSRIGRVDRIDRLAGVRTCCGVAAACSDTSFCWLVCDG